MKNVVSEYNSSGVASDGGTSVYYDLRLPKEVTTKIIERLAESGESYIKTEEIIECVFGNDFDFGNSFKSLVRACLTTKGVGKKGNTLDYELNKIVYSVEKIRARNKEVI